VQIWEGKIGTKTLRDGGPEGGHPDMAVSGAQRGRADGAAHLREGVTGAGSQVGLASFPFVSTENPPRPSHLG
jgi:hypothetical protein